MLTVAAAAVAAAAFAREPADSFARALGRLRAEPAEVVLGPRSGRPPLALPFVDSLLADPVGWPERAGELGRAARAAEGLRGLVGVASSLLTASPAGPEEVAGGAPVLDLPDAVAGEVRRLCAAARRAEALLAQAAAPLDEAERRALEARFAAQLVDGPPEPLDARLFAAAARFEVGRLVEGAALVAAAADAAAGALGGVAAAGTLPRSFTIDGATVTLGGPGDDVYSAEELAASTVVLDLGGDNRYLGPPAAAGPGQVRLVVDLGREVALESDGPAASGRFGIGLLHLGNPSGAKRLRGGRFSLGAGLFGAGLLLVRGDGSSLESRDFSQGAGAFGVGILAAEGRSLVLSAALRGQGFGYTRGVGLLRVRGPRATLDCGRVYADPREPEAALSFCQGAAQGPREFAGGGIGLAVVDGDEARVDSSYFAQGVGYWHSLGGFFLDGGGARVQARRYGKGAGVHAALGLFEASGGRHRLLQWGVGPAFGWDRGAGAALVRGDRHTIRSDWASGKGDLGGLGLLRVEGTENRLRLGELGTGTVTRSGPGYGVAVVSGAANAVWVPGLSSATAAAPPTLLTGPWGVTQTYGDAVLHRELEIDEPRFPALDGGFAERAARDQDHNALRLADADRLAAPERLARWLFSATEGGLDDRMPGQALLRLLALTDAEAALLPRLAAPERIGELALLRVLLAAYGRRVSEALIARARSARGPLRAALVGLLAALPAREAARAARSAASDADPRVRREAFAALAALFGSARDGEYADLGFLEAVSAACAKDDAAAAPPVGQPRLAAMLSVLSLAGAHPEARQRVASQAPDPFGPAPARTVGAFVDALSAHAGGCRDGLGRELRLRRSLLPSAARRLLEGSRDGDPGARASAVRALAALKRPGDAERFASLWNDPSNEVREAAAAALGGLGASATRALTGVAASPEPRARAWAAVAASHSSDPAAAGLLAAASDDPSEDVRATASSASAARSRSK
ncbi:MAG: HEAT repeat domain-containing protein [Elusimicrobia bacterium]|nr:HEAT repeat domain-containing protein [Elusimicrobiota bacterium]